MPDDNDDIEWIFLASTPRDQAEVDRLQAEVKRLKEQVRRLKAALSR
jgi:polyhydroxyalkanoate synthesis regulator phasin